MDKSQSQRTSHTTCIFTQHSYEPHCRCTSQAKIIARHICRQLFFAKLRGSLGISILAYHRTWKMRPAAEIKSAAQYTTNMLAQVFFWYTFSWVYWHKNTFSNPKHAATPNMPQTGLMEKSASQEYAPSHIVHSWCFGHPKCKSADPESMPPRHM